MQIQQYNNAQNINQNFKMALKINPKLRPQIQKEGIEFVKMLETYGEEASEVKMYDVVLKDSLKTPRVEKVGNPNKDYFAELKNEENYLGEYYTVTTGDDTVSGYNPNEPDIFRYLYSGKAAEEYEKFKNLSEMRQAIELSRLLVRKDNKCLEEESLKETEIIIQKYQEEKLNQKIDNLLDKYKYDQPVSIDNKDVKKSFWQRLFHS